MIVFFSSRVHKDIVVVSAHSVAGVNKRRHQYNYYSNNVTQHKLSNKHRKKPSNCRNTFYR